MEVKMFNRSGQSAGKAFGESLGYYLSGFTDGEGSFTVFLLRYGEFKSVFCLFNLSFTFVEFKPLAFNTSSEGLKVDIPFCNY